MTTLLQSTPVLFISAMVYHMARLVSFRHNGVGLPASDHPFVVVFVVLHLVLQPLRAYFFVPELELVVGLMLNIGFTGLMYWLSRGSRLRGIFSGYLLLNSGIAVLGIVGAQLWGESLDALRLTLEVWAVLAFSVFFWRSSRPLEV